MSITLVGGDVVTPNGVVRADVRTEGGVITAIGKRLSTGGKTVEVTGCYVLPGGVDPHCHLIDDLESSSGAAARGGTTTALSFTLPVDDEHPVDAFKRARELVERGMSVIDIGLHAMCYRPNLLDQEDLQRLSDLGADAVKIFLAYPELGIMASGAGLYRTMRAASQVGLPVQVHCEDGELIEALVVDAAEQGVEGPEAFADVRPPQLEDVAVNRSLTVASLTHADCYITHLSSAGAIEYIRRARTVQTDRRVTAEACLHHILLDAAEYRGSSAQDLLVAPPLRGQEHVDAVRAAVKDGTIDAIGSDHAQHRTPVDERLCPHGGEYYGIAGIGARLPLMLSWGIEHGISIERLAYVLSTGPARSFGYSPQKGEITVGSDADLVVWDPMEEWIVEGNTFEDGTNSSPYVGRQVRGQIRSVFLRGHCLVQDGVLSSLVPGRFITRTRRDEVVKA